MLGQRLYKIEKLRSEIAIGQLFDRSNPAAHSVMAYPLRAVWTINPSRLAALTQPPTSQPTALPASSLQTPEFSDCSDNSLPLEPSDYSNGSDNSLSSEPSDYSDSSDNFPPSDNPHRKAAPCPQFLIAVPKKKIRHAVDRVQMRRRIREAYRLNRHLIPMDLPIDIAFIYVAGEVLPYADVLKAVTRILTRITRTLTAPATTISPNS